MGALRLCAVLNGLRGRMYQRQAIGFGGVSNLESHPTDLATIESVLWLTYPSAEVIVVDDGPVEETRIASAGAERAEGRKQGLFHGFSLR